jgi:hypothetical protein
VLQSTFFRRYPPARTKASINDVTASDIPSPPCPFVAPIHCLVSLADEVPRVPKELAHQPRAYPQSKSFRFESQLLSDLLIRMAYLAGPGLSSIRAEVFFYTYGMTLI